MLSGLAEMARQLMQRIEKDELVLETNPRSNMGYTNVIQVKGKYQVRLHVKGNGRGGTRNRGQYSLPGLFDTAKEAAEYLAYFKMEGMRSLDSDGIPKKQ